MADAGVIELSRTSLTKKNYQDDVQDALYLYCILS